MNKISPEDEIQRLEDRLKENPDCGITHYNIGVNYLALRNMEKAKDYFKEAIKKDQDIAEAYVQLGGIAMNEGDLDGCFSYNDMASKIRHRFAVPHGNMGFVHLQKNNIDKAIASLKRAISFDPQFVQAHATLGSACLMQGDVDGCIAHSKKAIELEPKFGPAYNNMVLAYMEKNDNEEAKKCFEKAKETGYEVATEVLKEVEEKLSS